MTDAPQIVADVVREHVETAAFQWAQRDTLVHEEKPDMDAVAWVDTRLEAHLDGLRIAGEAAWPFVIDAFETYPEKGELFVVTFLALVTENARRLDQALGFARVAEDGDRGLCGAFAWLPPTVTAPVVRDWIDSNNETRLMAALHALASHGGSLGVRRARLMSHQSERVQSFINSRF